MPAVCRRKKGGTKHFSSALLQVVPIWISNGNASELVGGFLDSNDRALVGEMVSGVNIPVMTRCWMHQGRPVLHLAGNIFMQMKWSEKTTTWLIEKVSEAVPLVPTDYETLQVAASEDQGLIVSSDVSRYFLWCLTSSFEFSHSETQQLAEYVHDALHRLPKQEFREMKRLLNAESAAEDARSQFNVVNESFDTIVDYLLARDNITVDHSTGLPWDTESLRDAIKNTAPRQTDSLVRKLWHTDRNELAELSHGQCANASESAPVSLRAVLAKEAPGDTRSVDGRPGQLTSHSGYGEEKAFVNSHEEGWTEADLTQAVEEAEAHCIEAEVKATYANAVADDAELDVHQMLVAEGLHAVAVEYASKLKMDTARLDWWCTRLRNENADPPKSAWCEAERLANCAEERADIFRRTLSMSYLPPTLGFMWNAVSKLSALSPVLHPHVVLMSINATIDAIMRTTRNHAHKRDEPAHMHVILVGSGE